MENGRSSAKPKFATKSFTSFCIAGLLVVMGVSGTVLYVSPRCRDAYDAGWTFLGLGKDQWDSLHMNASLLFLLVAVVHLALNWQVFWSYVRRRSQQGLNRKAELGLATAVLALLVWGTLANWKPFNQPLAWRLEIKNYWSEATRGSSGRHFGELTLSRLASESGLPESQLVRCLAERGYEDVAASQTIWQIAERNGVSPGTVWKDLQPEVPVKLVSDSVGRRHQGRFGRGRSSRAASGGRGGGPWWLATVASLSSEGESGAGEAELSGGEPEGRACSADGCGERRAGGSEDGPRRRCGAGSRRHSMGPRAGHRGGWRNGACSNGRCGRRAKGCDGCGKDEAAAGECCGHFWGRSAGCDKSECRRNECGRERECGRGDGPQKKCRGERRQGGHRTGCGKVECGDGGCQDGECRERECCREKHDGGRCCDGERRGECGDGQRSGNQCRGGECDGGKSGEVKCRGEEGRCSDPGEGGRCRRGGEGEPRRCEREAANELEAEL